tara:strand:- start:188 stop:415 length:228 start_codon:yes stop_codon:yes gene_type:complete
LPCPITFEFFETIAGRNAQIFNLVCDLQLPKRTSSDRLYIRQPRNALTIGKASVSEHRKDEVIIATRRVINVKRE